MGSASFKSVAEMFHHRVRSTPDTDAFYHRVNGQWQTMIWRTVGERARAIACGLRSLGLQNEERVSLFSATRVEWILADMGILCAAGATTTIYPSNTPDEAEFIINNSGSVVVICDTEKQVAKLLSVRAKIPGLKHVVCMEGASSADGWVMGLNDLEAKGKAWDAANPGEYDRVADAVGPESLATLMYTSGTTGNPKGVMLTHDCWVYEGEAIDSIGLLSPADKQFLFLPLSHSFAKVLESAIIRIGVPTAVDGDLNSLVENLGTQGPTFMAGVPRIFEKVYNRIITKAKDDGGIKLKIFQWALSVGRQASQLRQKGEEPGGFLALKLSIADRLVFSKIKKTFGGRIRFFISGSAPLSREIAEFFHAADILICEGYGLTETSAASFVNRPEKYRFGTVGLPLPGTEVKIAEDGEILIKGRGVMRGYYNLPEQTAETLRDGWLYTGDIGQLEDGFLRITDRKKDLIKTSGGKYVAPQELENKLKVRCTLLAQALVHGNNRNFCSVLVTLGEDSAKSFYGQNGMTWVSYDEATKNEKVRAEVAAAVESLNKELPSYATLKKFAILPLDLTQEEGDLTPSLKVKRKTVEAKYKSTLDGFYAGATAEL